MEETNRMEEYVMNRINEWELLLFVRRIRIALIVVLLAILLIAFFCLVIPKSNPSSSSDHASAGTSAGTPLSDDKLRN